MQCPNCHFDNPDDSKFCKECGTNILAVDNGQPSLTQTFDTPACEIPRGAVFANRYEILEKIGEGGMGEVYSALDRNLNRRVAIKVLPVEFADNSERLARFEREAKLLAALNHPNIASIYGLEESEGWKFLVLELVEGETFLKKLRRGPLVLEETLDLCRQLAEGLEAAHEKGIIHRDLKPGNIIISPDGRVKILDFGLAKIYSKETSEVDVAKTPTITDQMTKPGIVWGTAAYMSPEQARGHASDKRTDIWAFGCILFECLTGERVFSGETTSDIMAHILKAEPDWSQLPLMTPPMVETLLRRCLRKDPRSRLHDIADARLDIVDAVQQPVVSTNESRRHIQKPGWFIGWALLLIVVGMAGRAIYNRWVKKPYPGQPVHSTINLPPGMQLSGGGRVNRTEIVLSPNGQNIIFSAGQDGALDKAKIYKRSLDSLEALPVDGTEGGSAPFYSPDGDWIGFWAEQKLYKVPSEGGIPIALCDAPNRPYGALWARDGRIFLGTLHWGIQAIPENGGEWSTLIDVDKEKEMTLRLPYLLPDGNALIFTSMPHVTGVAADIELFSFETGERRVLIEDGTDARYLPTGHLIFLRNSTLMAVPFDLNNLKISGSVVPVMTGVRHAINDMYTGNNSGAGLYSFSDSGLFAYVAGGITPDPQVEFFWVDRKGKAQPWAEFGKRPAFLPRLSPDGREVAYHTQGLNNSIWIYDIERNTNSRLITPPGSASSPIWDPTGTLIALSWSAQGPHTVWRMAKDGSGKMEQLTESDIFHYPVSWSPDGKYIAFSDSQNLMILNMEDKKVLSFASGPDRRMFPEFSPDGRWLAYSSDETGRREIYVSSFPEGDKKHIISNRGGMEPLWSRDGKELFYWETSTRLMKVDISIDQKLNSSAPKALFEFPSRLSTIPIRNYDVTPDGERFLVGKSIPRYPAGVTQINLIQNWFEELKRIVPIK
jgi:serine/threonine-protein kinase